MGIKNSAEISEPHDTRQKNQNFPINIPVKLNFKSNFLHFVSKNHRKIRKKFFS